MATDTHLLKGEVTDKPEQQEIQVERLLAGLLDALLAEQAAGAAERSS